MSSVEQRVVELIAEAAGLPIDEVKPEVALEALGMGSLEKIECVLNIEDTFHIEINERDLWKLRTVQDVTDAVRQASAARSQT